MERIFFALSLLSVGFGFTAGIFFSLAAQSMLPTHYVEAKRVKLLSLRDRTAVEGFFVLGTGSIKQVEYYAYYRAAGNGMKKDWVPVASSTIVETDSDPELVIYKNVYKQDWYWYLGGKILPSKDQALYLYELHVPKGTVVQKFTLE